jgi:hypothetical protein
LGGSISITGLRGLAGTAPHFEHVIGGGCTPAHVSGMVTLPPQREQDPIVSPRLMPYSTAFASRAFPDLLRFRFFGFGASSSTLGGSP